MRVIAGSLGGRTLLVPKGSETRPTIDRVKEALFSMLGSMRSLNVLDLYAGTGALGIEALSRGASHALFVEAGGNAVRCLAQNLRTLNLMAFAGVVHKPVERAKREILLRQPYDVVFCDPPWPIIDAAWKFLANLDVGTLLSPAGRLVLEHPANRTANRDGWAQMSVICVRAWGDSAITILESAAMTSRT
jgi:16S rRNA (guanine966-N2)-methyltransferase